MILPSKISTSPTTTLDISSGIVPAKKGINQYLPFITKVFKFNIVDAHIIVIVYDVTVNPSENRIRYWLNEVEKYCPEETTIILVGNKIDLLRN